MNKAFTANINDQVTARGYLDENDQLIMLEPEGSGGGDFTTANVSIIEENSEKPSCLMPIIGSEGVSFAGSLAFAENGNYKAILYKGLCMFVLANDDYKIDNVTGSATVFNNDRAVKISGDCTIKIVHRGS